MSPEQNKAQARRFYDACNQHNPSALDDLLHPDYVSHSPPPGVTPSREGMKQWIAGVVQAFPDICFTVEKQVAEGDLVVTRWMARGTHLGSFMGLLGTGTPVTVTGINIVRFENGKGVESWGEWDQLSMIEQLGTIPSMETA